MVNSIHYKSEEGDNDGEFNASLVTLKVRLNNLLKGDHHKKDTIISWVCLHMLRVLNKVEIDEIPSYFNLRKWMKGANSFRVHLALYCTILHYLMQVYHIILYYITTVM